MVIQKINIHTKKAEYLPAAAMPMYGSLDICLITPDPIETILKELKQKKVTMVTDIVERTGTLGKIKSIYLRDPDGNLVEISSYNF